MSEQDRIAQIQAAVLDAVIHAEDEGFGCVYSDETRGVLFCCYWHGRRGDDRCRECAALENAITRAVQQEVEPILSLVETRTQERDTWHAEANKQARECGEALADRDITQAELTTLRAERDRLHEALTKLRDCDWTIGRGDRMDAVRDIARAALTPQEPQG